MSRHSKEEVTAVASEPTLEERLAAMTKERDDLATKYALLLQENGAPTTLGEAILGPKDGDGESVPGRKYGNSDDSTLGPKEASRTRRTRRQRLLNTIDGFLAHIHAMIAELDMEALDVAHECEVTRQELEAASAQLKDAESRFAEELENVKAVVEEYAGLLREKDMFKEQERALTAELDGPQLSGTQRTVVGKKQRLEVRLQQAQAHLKDTEGLMAMTEGDYQKGCEQVELAATEMEKLKRTVQGMERELGEWLSPESEWFTKELENFRALQSSISTSLGAMRDGLEDSWEGKLGDNAVFLEGLADGYPVHPGISKDWAPVIESLFLSQVSLVLSKEMSKFHSAVLQRLKFQEDSAQREWKGGEANFEQLAPRFKKSSLPQLTPFADVPGAGVPQNPLSPSEAPGTGVPQDLPPPLHGHAGGIWSVVFSRDGTKVISGSNDNTIRVWDASTGQVQKVLEGHSGRCTSVAISGDGSWIVSGSRDKTVRIWDARTGKVQRVLEGKSHPVKTVALSWDGSRICSGSSDNTVRVWERSTGVAQSVLKGHTGGVNSVAFSQDGKWIASGAWDTTLRVWDASLTTCSLHKVLRGHPNAVSSVAFSGDGTRIVSGSYDHTVRIWDLSTGDVMRNMERHTDLVTSIAISRDGGKVVSGSYDKTVRVWDASTGEVQRVLEGHNHTIRSVAFSPDGRRVASGADDSTIRIWDIGAPAALSH